MPAIPIPIPPHFSFAECLWFLDRNFDDCMHAVKDGGVRKAVLINDEPVLIDITASDADIIIQILQGNAEQEIVKAYVENWFDLNTDLRPFYKLLKQHKQLAYMADDFAGLRLIRIPDLFEALCWSIIGQQINLTFAYKLKRRLVERYGVPIGHEGTVYHVFPKPEVLAVATVEELRAMQFSGSKAQYVIDTAKAFAEGKMSKEALQHLPDFTSRQQALIALRGIGIWTANYVLMKTLKDPNAIPYGDAGLLNALMQHGIISDKKDAAALHQLFISFPGWESYLVFYLWRSLVKK